MVAQETNRPVNYQCKLHLMKASSSTMPPFFTIFRGTCCQIDARKVSVPTISGVVAVSITVESSPSASSREVTDEGTWQGVVLGAVQTVAAARMSAATVPFYLVF